MTRQQLCPICTRRSLHVIGIEHANAPPEASYYCVDCDKYFSLVGDQFAVVVKDPICDFCMSLDIRWWYSCTNFPFDALGEPIIESLGDWAACDPCAALIEQENRQGLLDRALAAFFLKYLKNELPPQTHEPLAAELRELHDKFFKRRSGVRIAAKEADANREG